MVSFIVPCSFGGRQGEIGKNATCLAICLRTYQVHECTHVCQLTKIKTNQQRVNFQHVKILRKYKEIFQTTEINFESVWESCGNNHSVLKTMKIHHVLNGGDGETQPILTKRRRIVRVALLLRFLTSESHSATLHAKVMRIPTWESKFWRWEKQDVQALRSHKMKPAQHRGKLQKANRKKEVEPDLHRRGPMQQSVTNENVW